MYPVSYEADPAIEGRNRLTSFFRPILDIPWLIVAGLYGIAAQIAVFIAWFAIVFTGEYPPGLYEFNAKFTRLIGRVNSYLYLATDESPPLNGEPDDSYPVRVGVPERLSAYDRLKTGLRLIYGIPVLLINYVQGLIGGVVALIAWFAIVFTGKMPEGLVRPLHSALAYTTKASAYFLLVTEDYPPFSDEGRGPVAAEIPARTREPQP
jgi:Domain of unknown function (DUF4389)